MNEVQEAIQFTTLVIHRSCIISYEIVRKMKGLVELLAPFPNFQSIDIDERLSLIRSYLFRLKLISTSVVNSCDAQKIEKVAIDSSQQPHLLRAFYLIDQVGNPSWHQGDAIASYTS